MGKMPKNKNDLVYQWMRDVQETNNWTPQQFEQEVEMGDVYNPSTAPGKNKRPDFDEKLLKNQVMKWRCNRFPWIPKGSWYFGMQDETGTRNWLKKLVIPTRALTQKDDWRVWPRGHTRNNFMEIGPYEKQLLRDENSQKRDLEWLMNMQIGPLKRMDIRTDARNSQWWGIDFEAGPIEDGAGGLMNGFHIEKDYQTKMEAEQAAREIMNQIDGMTIGDFMSVVRQTITDASEERIVGSRR